MSKNLQIGEIAVPGPSRSSGIKTFILTSQMSEDSAGVEVLFGILAAEAPRKIIEKLTERLSDALRPAFFGTTGDSESRYETVLKQANKTILAFLHEHRLSLPGIKLRGVVGVLSDDVLMVSNRGSVRGLVLIPRNGKMTSISLFKEGSDNSTNPKFFSSFQSGKLTPGSMIITATRELFSVLDEPYIKRLFSEKDSVEASREIRQVLKGKSQVAALTITLPGAEEAATAKQEEVRREIPRISIPRASRASIKRRRAGQPLLPVNMDIGEVGAKSIEGLLLLILKYLKIIPQIIWAGIKGLGIALRLLTRVPKAASAISSTEGRKEVMGKVKALPRAISNRGVERFNSMPLRSKAHLLLLLIVSAVFIHGILFSFHRHSVALAARSYEAKLAEVEQLKTDLDTSLIIGNDRRSHDILYRLEGLVAALSEKTDNELKAKNELLNLIVSKRSALRREVNISQPEQLAFLEDINGEYANGIMTWFDKSLYIFSRKTNSVKTVSLDGSVNSLSIEGFEGGPVSVAPARTGILLVSSGGSITYWNPTDGEIVEYPDTAKPDSPILYYEGRLYSVRDDGMIIRRSILNKRLGPDTNVLQSPSDLNKISGLAADGAAYLMSPSGELRKYMKGLPVGEFKPPVIDPKPNNSGSLWTNVESEWLVFIDVGGDRVFMVESGSGKLAAQLTSASFSRISSAAVDPRGEYVYLLDGRRILSVPLKAPSL